MLEFRALLVTEKPDIVAITETWIRTNERDFIGEFEIPGYKLFHKDRTGREGGGVALYFLETLSTTEFTLQSEKEMLCTDLMFAKSIFRFIIVYRPPHRCLEEDYELYAEITNLINDRTAVIMGDFNCPTDWEDRRGDDESRRLIKFADETYLTQWVNDPTRGDNTLDLVFTTEDNLVQDLIIDPSLGTSDHNMIRFKLRVPEHGKRSHTQSIPDLRRANLHGLREGIGAMQVEVGVNVEESWNSFHKRFMAQQSKFVPNKLIGEKRRQPKWFTREIEKAIRERKASYRRYKVNHDNLALQEYTISRRKVKRMIETAKRSEEQRVAAACKTNPKEFFSHVNSRKPVKNKIGPLRDEGGTLRSTDLEMANILNEHFSAVFTDEVDGEIPEPILVHEGVPLDHVECSNEEVLNRLKKLCPNKSPGPDGFLPKLLKESGEVVAPHLGEIFRSSMRTGEVPKGWREANVTPIFKKGDHGNPGNYRLISLTSVVVKLLEGIIADKIVDFLEENNLLLGSQHGFRRHRSCLTNLIEFFHGVMQDFDRERAVDIIYLDFAKAFDKVPHLRLMAKVRDLGIQGALANWIEAWLKDRRQRVVINGTSSSWTSVKSGVPQGSVLGPLLFIIYINDIDVGMVSRVAKFADDTKLGASVSNPDNIKTLKLDLIKIAEWSERWQMPFNLDKCKVMHIGHANQRANYSMLDHDIEKTNLEKDLGVLISSDLKSTKQCIEVEKKAQRLLGYIKRQFRYRNKEIVLSLYNSLVRPHLEYAVQFWSPSLRMDVQRLERVQRRATKLIPSIRHMDYQSRLRALNLFSLESRRLRGQLIEAFKILRGFDNVDHQHLFTLNESATRSHGWKLVPPRYTCNTVGGFFTYSICNTWNALPAEVVNSSSVEQFKTRLDRVLHTLV